MSITWWIDTQNMACLYNGILFSHTTGRGADSFYNMEICIYTPTHTQTHIHAHGLKTSCWIKDRPKDGPHSVWFHLHELPLKGKYTSTESKSLIPRS